VWPNSSTQRIFGIICFTVVYAIPGFIVIVTYTLIGCRLCQRQLLPEFEETCSSNSQAQSFQSPQVKPSLSTKHSWASLLRPTRDRRSIRDRSLEANSRPVAGGQFETGRCRPTRVGEGPRSTGWFGGRRSTREGVDRKRLPNYVAKSR